MVTAGGTGNSTNVTLTDTLPAGFNWTVGGTNAAACSPASPVAGGTTLTCNFGTMAPGAIKSITLTTPTTTADCGTIKNTATVAADVDVNPSNNTSGASPITIDVLCPAPSPADVSVVKTTHSPIIILGLQSAQYTITVKANGPADSENVVLTDTLPDLSTSTGPVQLKWTVGGADAAACSPAPSPITSGRTPCSFGKMLANTSRTITLTAPTDFSLCFTRVHFLVSNTAKVSSTNDSDPSNNTFGPVLITPGCSL